MTTKNIVRSTRTAEGWQVVLFKDENGYASALVDVAQQKHGIDRYKNAEEALVEYVKRCAWNSVEA